MKDHRRKRLRDLELAAGDRTTPWPDWVYLSGEPPNETRAERKARLAEQKKYEDEAIALGLGEYL